MRNYSARRVELSPEWLNEANAMEVELPAVVFENEKGRTIINYSEFEKLYKKPKESNKIKDKKNASSKEKEVKQADEKGGAKEEN